ncbi:translocon-associated protein, gamma subunit (TRAP-gamma) domain-containing protein [Ditylenchus destructor]|nr:translocon-associated protein, gamma subunit (TRAP-gamma) domain-containing protein [Ditylenchus destructor]
MRVEDTMTENGNDLLAKAHFTIFRNNILFFGLLVFLSFFMLSSISPIFNCLLSMYGPAGLVLLFSTSMRNPEHLAHFTIFRNNILFFDLLVFLSFFILSSMSPIFNCQLSMYGAAGPVLLFSTSMRNPEHLRDVSIQCTLFCQHKEIQAK